MIRPMTAARKLSVYEEFAVVPKHLVAEIINGELRTHPRPATLHARAVELDLGVLWAR
jgi:hypothetical protein